MIALVLGIVVAVVAAGLYVLVRYLTRGDLEAVPGGVARGSAGSSRHGEKPGTLPAIDLEELTAWVAAHLPGNVSNGLTSEDIRRIVQWNLDFIQSKRASSNGHSDSTATIVTVAGAETVDYVLERADADGIAYTSEQVHAVLDAQMAYLESIGAAGPELPPDGGS